MSMLGWLVNDKFKKGLGRILRSLIGVLAQYLPGKTNKPAVDLRTKMYSAEIQTHYLSNGGLEIYANLFFKRVLSFADL